MIYYDILYYTIRYDTIRYDTIRCYAKHWLREVEEVPDGEAEEEADASEESPRSPIICYNII